MSTHTCMHTYTLCKCMRGHSLDACMQTDRQTDRQTNRQTNRQTDRQTGRQAGRQTHTDAHACIHTRTPQTHMTYIAYAHPCMHMPVIYRLGLASASVELLEVVVPRSCAVCIASWKSLCWSRCFPREIGLGQVSTCFSLRLCELSGLVCVIQKATARSWNNDPHEPMQWNVKTGDGLFELLAFPLHCFLHPQSMSVAHSRNHFTTTVCTSAATYICQMSQHSLLYIFAAKALHTFFFNTLCFLPRFCRALASHHARRTDRFVQVLLLHEQSTPGRHFLTRLSGYPVPFLISSPALPFPPLFSALPSRARPCTRPKSLQCSIYRWPKQQFRSCTFPPSCAAPPP